MASNDTLVVGADSLRTALSAQSGPHPLVDALAADTGGNLRIDATPQAVLARASAHGPGRVTTTLLDLEIRLRDVVLHTMRGGQFESVYPPEAFTVSSRTIHPRLRSPWPERHSRIEFGSEHGCSSDAELPLFLLSTDDGSAGLWFSIGWTGSWRATLTKLRHQDVHRLVIHGPGPEIDLADGEELDLPPVVVGAYTGDGWAAVRDHLASLAPAAPGPWVVYNTWFNENAAIDAQRLLATVQVAKEIGVEVVTLDGAWYRTDGGESMDFTTSGIGTWIPDPVRFPDGLEPIAAAVAEAGMRFGLWCEIERAHPDSEVAVRHPEWLRSAPGEALGLLDLGRDDVVDWCLEMLGSMIVRWNLGWVKLDMTTHDISAYWAGDARAELGHIRGLYRVLDGLHERHADLIIEGCASGGNRIDQEMVARCHTFWISDQTQSPDMVRATVAGARRILPARYCYLSVSPGLEEPPAEFPAGWLLGVMPGVFGIMDPLRTWPQSLRNQVARHIRTYCEIRPMLDGTPTRFTSTAAGSPLTDWDALELASEAGDILFAHRLLSPDPSRAFTGARHWAVTLDEPGGACLEIDKPITVRSST
jgi:alpha-galactosidase